ncbi:MAG: DUF4843 domain-containing protein [Duncaniella sp.]|nr:DUF4843 domain-containing protein [Duncaniella sp.]
MKRYRFIRNITLAFAALGVLSACEHEEVDVYNTDHTALNLGFTSVRDLTAKANHNFSETAGVKGVTFYARISGVPVDYDRTFSLEPVDGDIALLGNAWVDETYVIPAGAVSGEYVLNFDTSLLPDPANFAEKEGTVTFRAKASDTFRLGADGYNELVFTLYNSLAKPDDWDSGYGYYTALVNYFGEYSTEKFRFMIENGFPTQFRIKTLQKENFIIEDGITVMSTPYATYMLNKLQKALAEYNYSHFPPLCDSLGNPITF